MFRVPFALVFVLAGAIVIPAQQPQTAPPQQQPPVFRGGAHFVRVDAYPVRDGRILEDLTAADFEVLEDGKPQAIDTFQFIKFGAFTTDEERRDPNSQRDAFALAADPNYRVFVLYLDAYHVDLSGSHGLRQPLVAMLNRILGPRDLFGMLTPRQRPQDLILGRQSKVIEEQLGGETNWIWGLQGRYEPEPEEFECFGAPDDRFPDMKDANDQGVIARRRLDKVFSDLEELVALLGGLRQERKNLLVFSRGWRFPDPKITQETKYVMPPVGITNAGKLTLGTRSPGAPNELRCETERMRVMAIDFAPRFRELLTAARRANVAFYPVNPSGLEAPGEHLSEVPPGAFPKGKPPDNVLEKQMNAITSRTDRLLELADNTDGVAVVNSNDLNPGLARIANDLSAYYVLGYYTTNTKWNGGIRKITVRLKNTKESVRARREYRAPTEAEMASMRAAMTAPAAAAPAGPTPADALGELVRLRPTAVLLAHGSASATEVAVSAEITAAAIEVGRWKAGGDVEVTVSGAGGENVGSGRGRIEGGSRGTIVRVPLAGTKGPWTAAVRLHGSNEADQVDRIRIAVPSGLLGDPIAYRATPAPASPLRPVGAFQFRRTERLHVEWAVLQPLDRREARLLGRDGQPLAFPIDLGEREVAGATVLGIDLILAPLTAGDYVIEVTAGAGSTSDKKLLAIRVVR